jgi:hypothetical protein
MSKVQPNPPISAEEDGKMEDGSAEVRGTESPATASPADGSSSSGEPADGSSAVSHFAEDELRETFDMIDKDSSGCVPTPTPTPTPLLGHERQKTTCLASGAPGGARGDPESDP